MKKGLSLLLALLLLLLVLPTAFADVIWTPQDDFFESHSEDCTYIDHSYTVVQEVSAYASPLKPDKVVRTFPTGTKIYVSFGYTDASGAQWGVVEDEEGSCWLKLETLTSIYNGDDFYTDHESEFTPYAQELGDVSTAESIGLWSYPHSGEMTTTLNPADWEDFADTFQPDVVYTDADGLHFVHIGYFMGIKNVWVCAEDLAGTGASAQVSATPAPTTTVQPTASAQPTASVQPTEPVQEKQGISVPNMFLIGGVALVVLLAAFLISFFFGKKAKK